MMIGKSADELSQIGAKKAHRDVTEGEQPIVSVKQLGLKGTINPTDLDIYPGQVVGFAGLLGSGRTELGRLLYGADKPDSGTYELKGKKTVSPIRTRHCATRSHTPRRTVETKALLAI